jgi:hypothetical protein
MPTTSRGTAGFTLTALDAEDNDVIGCVYLYPSSSKDLGRHGAVLGAGRQIGPRRLTRRRRRSLARHRLALEARRPLRSLSRDARSCRWWRCRSDGARDRKSLLTDAEWIASPWTAHRRSRWGPVDMEGLHVAAACISLAVGLPALVRQGWVLACRFGAALRGRHARRSPLGSSRGTRTRQAGGSGAATGASRLGSAGSSYRQLCG